MLAGNVMHVELALRDDAVGVVELAHLRQMTDVAGMDHEGGLLRQRDDLADRFLQRAARIGIGRLVEAHMAVADLQEGEPLRVRRHGLAHDAQRVRHAAGNSPKHAGADPGHAFEDFAPVYAIVAVEIAHCRSPLKLTGPKPRRLWRLLRTRSAGHAVYSRIRKDFFEIRLALAARVKTEEKQRKGASHCPPPCIRRSEPLGAFHCSRRCRRRSAPGRWRGRPPQRAEPWRRHAARFARAATLPWLFCRTAAALLCAAIGA